MAGRFIVCGDARGVFACHRHREEAVPRRSGFERMKESGGNEGGPHRREMNTAHRHRHWLGATVIPHYHGGNNGASGARVTLK